ncbi:FMN-dependent NADH-azoreductase [Herbaspirillum rubrisubalbicans Os34]|uniref:FMN dependent NADH:quinone oxidoreductase n=1 Tax=Herbaspirillum rubrisubalbicans Os34 TaxID=1235827 RepID=A0A6M3ZW50_9BURK|nr:NAD(P)H-dependent oxidoreductase [Herbaspirillum rubrisubalbicans]QJQ02473.1 FMN-dependent NADH-azoreductase [Herbaspirillum rubrisubalbicans Os34]
MRILNIIASPRGERSASIAVANAFLEACRKRFAACEIDTLNVWEEALPEFDSKTIGAKYKRVSKEPMTAEEEAAWSAIDALARRFQQAERIVIGVPMWNFAYPYKLKQLIDLVSQRNMLFSFDGSAYGPLLNVPRALAIHVRGQSQPAGAQAGSPGFEHQSDYIAFWLKFIGVQEVHSLRVEHTWDGLAQECIARAKESAVELAGRF